MTRAQMGETPYWEEWCSYADEHIVRMRKQIAEPAGDPSYRPQYVFNLVRKHYEQMLRRYSRGDSVAELKKYFPPMLAAWKESERLGLTVWTEEQQYTRHAWAVNLDHYIVCFWLVGLALSLEIPDDQWHQLVDLIGNEGEDVLLDRVIASRQPERRIGVKLCHPKPYKRLLDAINGAKAEQAKLLLAFLENWYVELDRAPKKGLSEKTAMYDRPYWHRYGNENFEGGAYFGRWCVEAVAAVKAFGIDDSLCLGHPYYPGDLLRTTGYETLPTLPQLKKSSETSSHGVAAVKSGPGWLARIFGKS